LSYEQVFTVYKIPEANVHGFETNECNIRLTYQLTHILFNALIFTPISEEKPHLHTCVEAVTIPMTSLVLQYFSTGEGSVAPKLGRSGTQLLGTAGFHFHSNSMTRCRIFPV